MSRKAIRMLSIEAKSIPSAVRSAYRQLYTQGIPPYDTDLELEDSATIVVDYRGSANLEACALKDGKLIYDFDYHPFFPFTEGLRPDFPDYEMPFWNADFTLPPGRLFHIIEHLRYNMQSRRALINLWDDSIHETSNNAPCVTQVSFRVKGHFLEMHSHVRANNISFLLFMDMQVMSGIHRIVADALKLEKGVYVHFVDSLHCYRREAAVVNKQYEYMLSSDIWNNAV